ncbi:MAG: prolyl oligopeptidase family serine peptidase [Patescibacteria group bacterium]
MGIPCTKKENVIEKIHGHLINDPYRWLESADTEETKKWIDAQNEHAFSSLKNGNFNIFLDELVKNFKTTTFSNPVIVRGKYFYTERQPNEDQFVIYVKNGLNGEPIKLVDPNGANKENTVSIDYWSESRSGKYIAYGLSEGGTEMSTLYIKNVDTKEDLPDTIVNCRHSPICWLPDDSGFFYTRNPRPNTVPKNEEHLHTKAYFHKLGDNPDDDELIFGKDRPKDDMIGLSLSLDGNYLAINASREWTRNDIYVFDCKNKKIIPLIKGVDARFLLWFALNKALILTNYKANNYRVLSTSLNDLFAPIEEWEEMIPERDYLLEYISITKEKIIAQYLKNACSKVIIFDYLGNEKGEIPLPAYSSTAGISTNREENEFFYGVSSFTFPKIIYRHDPILNKYAEYRRIDNPINPDDYVIEQEWFTSKDNTKIPIFIFHKKNLVKNGLNPAILYGYGGFSVSQTPAFIRNWTPWLEKNGVFAIPNIRGGSEFGSTWHTQAIKENKQKSFDDFIAAAEFLINQKYTDNNHLGIIGGSNGGLLVATVAVQKPDLFKAVCSIVPLTDMVRFPKFGMAIRWVHEYGNPEKKEELENILKWSPYHNVKENIEYPNFLFTTGLKDSRVDPLHARKMTAILQSMNKKNEVLIFTEIEVGHGLGKPISKIVEKQALVLSFFTKYLDLKNQGN